MEIEKQHTMRQGPAPAGNGQRRFSLGDRSSPVQRPIGTAPGVGLEFRWDPRGVLNMPALDDVLIAVHLGPAAKLGCRRDGQRFHGTAVHGDIDIIPAHTAMRWEMYYQNDRTLILSLSEKLLRKVTEESTSNGARLRMLNRFQIRDLELEKLSWAMKREMEMSSPSGRLYLDGLTLAIASRLVTRHSSRTKEVEQRRGGLTGNRLKRVLSFIEEQLAEDLSLEKIAAVAGVSPSHLNALFRHSMGMAVHQYVIQRRVEFAKTLLLREEMSIGEIALEAGFAHQSHLARHMRRALGLAPRQLKRLLGEGAGSS
jgi:AraC family transcriptional regulator